MDANKSDHLCGERDFCWAEGLEGKTFKRGGELYSVRFVKKARKSKLKTGGYFEMLALPVGVSLTAKATWAGAAKK